MRDTTEPLRVFISYTAEDLAPFADVVVDIVQRLGWIPVDHRKWAPSGRPSVQVCRDKIDDTDIVVVMVAHRYGWTPTTDEGGDGETSITWLEVKWAWSRGKEVLPYLIRPRSSWPADQMEGYGNERIFDRLKAFKNALQPRHAGFFSGDPESLRQTLESALRGAADRIRRRAAGSDRAVPAKRVRLVLPAHGGAAPITLTLNPADLANGPLNIEIVMETEPPRQEQQQTPEATQTISVAETDVLAIEGTDGSHRFISAGDFRDGIEAGEKPGRLGAIATQALKALRVLQIDDDEAFTRRGAREWVAEIEKSALPTPGVYNFADPNAPGKPLPQRRSKAREPLLLFLHGLALGSADTFHGLRNNSAWRQLVEHYGERLLAFEHHAVSVSPIENALSLARWLPAGATLHVISHSGGGLIGELLAMPSALIESPDDALARFRSGALAAATDARCAASEEDVKRLRALADIARKKTWRVERFLRVACPARGLGANKLDTFLSILMNLAGVGTQRSEVLRRLTLTAVKHRLTFEELPGLEAMMATSPLVGLINNPRWVSDADLTVVAGNVSEATQGRRLKVLFPDSYSSDAGDLVVPSGSTVGGWKRQGPVTLWEEGRTSTHYRYFDDDAVCRKAVEWLTSTVPSRGETAAR